MEELGEGWVGLGIEGLGEGWVGLGGGGEGRTSASGGRDGSGWEVVVREGRVRVERGTEEGDRVGKERGGRRGLGDGEGFKFRFSFLVF